MTAARALCVLLDAPERSILSNLRTALSGDLDLSICFSAGNFSGQAIGKWRRGRDSNPRYHLWYTPLAGERLRPLGHLSGPALISGFVPLIKPCLKLFAKNLTHRSCMLSVLWHFMADYNLFEGSIPGPDTFSVRPVDHWNAWDAVGGIRGRPESALIAQCQPDLT